MTLIVIKDHHVYLQLSLVNEPLGLHLHGQALVPLLGVKKTEQEMELYSENTGQETEFYLDQ